MTFRIVPRTEIGLPETVTNANGTPRPPLFNERWVTFHYTGVSSRGYATADVAAEVLRIQQVFSATKPFEYNYVIGQTDDESIYEFAGTFQAAHSAGENADSFGILFLNAVGEPLTATQIAKAQWLRDVLIFVGSLQVNPDQRPHRWMPDAATACPGDIIMESLPELVKPYVAPEVVLPYAPEQGMWALYPHLAKRDLRQGDTGPDVLYLNDALRLKAGQNVCGQGYNAATTRAVRNLQGYFGLKVDGWVGPQTWAIIDTLVKAGVC